jgi:hypothetical protein
VKHNISRLSLTLARYLPVSEVSYANYYVTTNMRPSDKRRTLWRDMTKLRRAGYRLRFRYVKLVVVLVGTQACLAMVYVSRRRDVRYFRATAAEL